MRRTAGWLLTGAALALIGACRSAPHESTAQPAARQCVNVQLESLGAYALTLRQQDEAALVAEKERLEAAPASTDRDLRLALLLGQRTAPTYDPEVAARLLTQVSASTPGDPTSKALAEMLFTSLPSEPRNCADSDEFRDLAAQLNVEQQKRQDTAARLESVRQELDAERAQREKLEQQLDALKSLEEQIKNRDNEPGR